jgi:hypothetical protein
MAADRGDRSLSVAPCLRVEITHTVRAGFRSLGRVLDPALKLVMSGGFARDLDAHVRTEFPLLRDLLRERRAGDALPSGT